MDIIGGEVLFMDKLDDYLSEVCKNVKFKPAHFGIKRELKAHFEDQIQEYVQSDMTLEQALDVSIADMGNPYDLGNQLNCVHKPHREWKIVLLLLLMLCFSVAISAVFQFISIPQYYYNYFYKLLIYVPIGGILVVILYRLDYRFFIRYGTAILILGMLLLLIINKWGDVFSRLVVGNYAFEVMPFAGICGVLGTASSLQYSRKKSLIIEIINALLTLIIFGLFMSLSQLLWALSQLIVYIATCIWLDKTDLSLHKYRAKKVIHIIVIVICGLILSEVLFNEIIRWLPVLLHPQAYSNSQGYALLMTKRLLSSVVPFGSSALISSGQSIGSSFSKVYVLLYIFSKFGYITGYLILLSVLSFVYFICRAAWYMKNTSGGAIATACCILLVLQFIIAICTNLGFTLPGLYSKFPFLSVGGIFMVSNMLLTAIILSIWRTHLEYHILYEKQLEEKVDN
jgi:cell division protein FtsW (lipid II flippase)